MLFSVIFVIANMVGMKWYLIVGFIYIAPVTNDTKYFFMCLLTICALFKSFVHLWIGFFFCCWVVAVLYIFWVILYQIYNLQMFSPTLWFSVHSLNKCPFFVLSFINGYQSIHRCHEHVTSFSLSDPDSHFGSLAHYHHYKCRSDSPVVLVLNLRWDEIIKQIYQNTHFPYDMLQLVLRTLTADLRCQWP